MARAFAAGAGAAFVAFAGFLLTLGGMVVTARFVLRRIDPIGRLIANAIKPPKL